MPAGAVDQEYLFTDVDPDADLGLLLRTVFRDIQSDLARRGLLEVGAPSFAVRQLAGGAVVVSSVIAARVA
ncbi:hypothetical protein G9U51_08375 [Calidifontibacter sp. DB0510]|uniref:Uncharacterized protein n=1 Tax=Metallococcus carri TaxID=1656884 RepID=A0A967AZ64_9MICO|nr:hypothetical protein [Metallococcus carri]NHN55791.1 hypothetical protein [Metallococcus carri]NOP38520.1 hypothetical protein [Calidifontibacter sp. DB2511S]